MKASQIAKAETTELLQAYVQSAVSQGEAIEAGDHRTANRHADTLIAIYRELRQRGPTAQAELIPLLAHPEGGVRFWAAAHALEFAPEQAEPVLAGIASIQRSFVALSANVTLRQWRMGDYKVP